MTVLKIHMIRWGGGKMPVADGTPVIVKRRYGAICTGIAGDETHGLDQIHWDQGKWTQVESGLDVVAYAALDVEACIHPIGTDVGALNAALAIHTSKES